MYSKKALNKLGSRSRLHRLTKPANSRQMSFYFPRSLVHGPFALAPPASRRHGAYADSLIPSSFYSRSGFPSLLDIDATFKSFHDVVPTLESHMSNAGAQVFPLAPKFDVKETEGAYVLEGELPGVRHEDVTVEFVDDSTMAIKARTESVREQGNKPAALTQGENSGSTAALLSNADAATSSPAENQSQADIESQADDASEAQPTNTDTSNTNKPNKSKTTTQPDPKPESASTYYLRERTVGSFQRAFYFPAKAIDHDAVKASLKNGVLSVTVPKVKNTESENVASRKVTIENDVAGDGADNKTDM